MQPNQITREERDRISDANAHLFIARHINDYWPCEINSQRMQDFISSQLGMSWADWPYPTQLEQFEIAFEYLSKNFMLLPRPAEEPEPEAPAVTRERLAQEKVRTDHAAQLKANEIARAKNIPLNQLAGEVGRQNAQFREQRDRNELPTRTPGLESRSLATVTTFGDKATARNNVALAHPSLNRNGADFARLYAIELQRLRQQ